MGAFKLEQDNPQIIMSGRLEHLFGGFTNMMPGENGVGEILEGFGECRVKRRPDGALTSVDGPIRSDGIL
jgi:hypothetical protein